jgi:putative SOS response-associated peptidase YedK
LRPGQDDIRRLFKVDMDRAGHLPSMPGVFPDNQAPVVRNLDGQRELIKMRWGTPPPPKFGGAPITNTRNASSPIGAAG